MRTIEQNDYYHAVVVELAKDFYTKNEAEFYRDAYKMLTGIEGHDVIHAMFKVLFNKGRTTQFKDDEKGRGIDKMGSYIDSIREWFYREHKLDIPPANEPRIEYE